MSSVVIVRPRHPFEGETLQMLGQMRRHGRLELLLVLPDGSKTLIPAAWTDLEATGEVAGPATVGALADLQRAAVLVTALLARDGEMEVQAARHPPCQEDDRAACTAEFDARDHPGATDERSRRTARAAPRGRDRRAGPADRQRRRGGQRGGRR